MESIKTLVPYLRESKGSLLSPNITMVFAASIPVRALVLIIDNLALMPTLEFHFDCY